MPQMATKLPSTFVALLREWQARELETFRTMIFSSANRSVSMAYNKRKYLYDEMVRRRVDQGLATLKASAMSLDEERGVRGQTMASFHTFLHSGDVTITRRKKRKASDETPPPSPPPPPPPPPRRQYRPGPRRPPHHPPPPEIRRRQISIMDENGRAQSFRAFSRQSGHHRPAWESQGRTSGGRDNR